MARWMVIGLVGLALAWPCAAATREREALDRVEADIERLDRELMALRVRHAAVPANEKPVVQAEFDRKTHERQRLLPRLYDATLKTYLAEPKPDGKINQMMSDTLRKHMEADRWEEAADFGKAMVDKGHPDRQTAELAGVAAFQANRFEDARKHLAAARQLGALSRDGERFASQVDEYVKLWEAERRIRQAESTADDLPRIRLETTAGNIDIELFENQAPKAVANFVHLVERGFYDGTPFHRVIGGFMAQGGDPTGTGTGGPGWAIRCECYREDYRRHFRGTLSMAHAGRDTGGSQFFITFVPTAHLDGRHTAFGRVIDGWPTLAQIVRRDPRSSVEPTTITRARVLRKRNYDYIPEKLPSRR
jgi:cyclophilin family peptidyl-prolyl cis-trans isomerase